MQAIDAAFRSQRDELDRARRHAAAWKALAKKYRAALVAIAEHNRSATPRPLRETIVEWVPWLGRI